MHLKGVGQRRFLEERPRIQLHRLSPLWELPLPHISAPDGARLNNISFLYNVSQQKHFLIALSLR